MLKYYLYKIGQGVASIFSFQVSYRIAIFLSDLKYYFSFRDRQAVHDNLQVILKDSRQARRMSKEVFRNFGKYLLEFFRMGEFTEQFIDQHVIIENQDRLDAALAKGKGIIIITAHMGNWELGGMALGRRGYPLTAIALPHREKSVNELFNHQREAGGVTVVPAHSAIRRCIRILRENGIVALLADRDFSATGVPMDFFGKKTMMPRGPAMFAYRTGAAVLPMFLKRTPDGKFIISIREPLNLPENIQQMQEHDFNQIFFQQQVAILEQAILEDPSQWLVFRRFWIDEHNGPERITST